MALADQYCLQVYSVDKGTGITKVSRKQLQNAKNSVPDHIRNLTSSAVDAIQELPTFPVIPPRKFSKDFFS